MLNEVNIKVMQCIRVGQGQSLRHTVLHSSIQNEGYAQAGGRVPR